LNFIQNSSSVQRVSLLLGSPMVFIGPSAEMTRSPTSSLGGTHVAARARPRRTVDAFASKGYDPL
jgi:hypothetical protein